jgi:hypothetical protein
MKIDKGRVKDVVLVEELMSRLSDIMMMKEEVLVIPKKIQDVEVLRKVLLALRLLMTGFEMTKYEVSGRLMSTCFHRQSPGLGTGHLTFKRIMPLWYALLKIFWGRIFRLYRLLSILKHPTGRMHLFTVRCGNL